MNHRRSGSGEPLVLLHGLGLSVRSWSPVLGLLEREREVLALDLPGFGGSPRLPAALVADPETLATAVEAALDEAGWETAHLAGNSLGGWVALELARRGRARSVAAISPAGLWTARERAYADRFLRTSYATARRLAPRAGVLRNPVARTLVLSGTVARPWRVDPDDAIEAVTGAARSDFLRTHEAMMARRCRGLEEVACPVLVAWGTRDLLFPAARMGPRFARLVPGAELRLLRGLGHVPMSDDPELVAQTVLAAGSR